MAKLTLSADRETIDRAKRLARERGISVSAMFSQFVEALSTGRRETRDLPPVTRRSRGLGKVSADISDRELFEKAIAASDRR